ncbi:hypothetical protein HLB23_38545 [Nocardia uniformis]|uniref:Cyclase n=1 Tax=Nocardia uniformis TaxID=53432 RepID=A0A849CGC5_9NOCA|nr:hypothetical protein [Nocardia uniformis]NNH75687.1 hypothetical protein [Nocardia uniformis]
MTTTLHIDNTVRDFDTWKTVFDKFDRMRAEHKVLSYRVSRVREAPDRVFIDLDFATLPDAEAFRDTLRKVTASPQSQALLTSHAAHIVDVVDEQVPGATRTA